MFLNYNHIISLENLYLAWGEFVKGKKNKKDVLEFALNLTDNIYQLHLDLKTKIYHHGPYQAFKINDPKPRDIHKALVRDRLLHHAIYRILYHHFNQKFIHDSYSCRLSKGTHKANQRFAKMARKVSHNHTKTVWILKCDVRKFFASINQVILLDILKKYESDPNIIWLLEQVISSFHSIAPGQGLPLGNLTSQLLVNIYLNEFDQFMKHQLKAKYYLRYADDFVIMATDKNYLEDLLLAIDNFLQKNLKLNLHPDKVYIKTLASGVDFLGWVHFLDHRVLRTVTKKRMLRRIKDAKGNPKTIQSYLGLLKWGEGYKLQKRVLDLAR